MIRNKCFEKPISTGGLFYSWRRRFFKSAESALKDANADRNHISLTDGTYFRDKSTSMTFGKTGEKCLIAGYYRCFGNHNQRITMQKEEIFPKPDKDHEGIWILTQKKENQDGNFSELYEKKH